MTLARRKAPYRVDGATVAAYTAQHGGGTFDTLAGTPVAPARGYAVGMAVGDGARLPLTVSADDLGSTATRVAQEYLADFVGTWIDGDAIIVDPVRILADYVSALGAAEMYGQRAIFGFAEGHTLEVN